MVMQGRVHNSGGGNRNLCTDAICRRYLFLPQHREYYFIYLYIILFDGESEAYHDLLVIKSVTTERDNKYRFYAFPVRIFPTVLSG